MTRVAVVDSGGANIASVLHALDRLGVSATFTRDHAEISAADRVILPGVGSAAAAMAELRRNNLHQLIPQLNQPVLGICLGMQLLFRHSEEGDTPLLGLVPAAISKMEHQPGLRIPHMGWNRTQSATAHPLMSGLDDTWFYFVHSYAAPVGEWTIAASRHGQGFSAAVAQRNFCGVQFHPERSAAAGARLLENFLQ